MDKLIRDKIPEVIVQNGGDPQYRTVDGEEAKRFATEKVEEELAEVVEAKTREQQVEELADLTEAVLHLGATYGITHEEVEQIRIAKLKQRGGFSLKQRGGFSLNLILEGVEK